MITFNRRSFFGMLAGAFALAGCKPVPRIVAFNPPRGSHFPDALGGLEVGDTFTIPGIYSINPRTRQETGCLQIHVYAGSDALFPPIIPDGAYQNCVVKAGADIRNLGKLQ